MMNGNLPDGWEMVVLGDVVKFQKGKKPDILAEESTAGFLPYVDIQAFEEKTVRKFGNPQKGVFVEADEIMLVWDGARAGLVGKSIRGLVGSTLSLVKPLDDINREFLYYFLQSYYHEINTNTKGIGIPHVNPEYLTSLPFPRVPVPEQERIVIRIEELLSDLDAGEAALERVRIGLKRYKASIIKSACEGNLLTDENRENHEDAKQLLQRLGKSPLVDEALPPLPKGWCWTHLGDLSKHITSGSRGWAQYYSEDGATFIRAQDINTDKLVLEDIAHVNPPRDSAEVLRTRVQMNDLLVTITGANVTKTAMVHIDLSEAYISQHVGLVRPTLPALSEYLYYWIISPAHGRKALEKMAYGAGKPGLNLANLRELLVALPPLDEQRRIVAEVERRLSVVGKVESAVEAGQVRAGRLRQSVLRSAFEGRL